MKIKPNRTLLIFSVIYYLFFAVMMAIGSVWDISVDLLLFQPESSFAKLAESFGQIVYWGMWGPAFTIILLSRHDLYEVVGFCRAHSKTKIELRVNSENLRKRLNAVFKAFYAVIFYVLAVIGWKKLIQNVTKNVLYYTGRENFGEAVYFVISATVAAVVLAAFCRLPKERFRKLEGAAFIGVGMGIFCKFAEEMKPLTERVRFREMVAYSNGFLNEKGMSEGRYSPLTREMAANTDFSAFTAWYRKGNAMGRYSRADSFPSGHTCYSCTVFLLYALSNCVEKLKKAAPYMLVFSFAYVLSMAIARMVAGAHYLTDVAAAAIIGYTAFLWMHSAYAFLQNKCK